MVIYYPFEDTPMIKNNFITIFFTISIGLVSAIAISTFSNTSQAFASHEFSANLTGQQEVPPVDTQATGEVVFVPVLPNNETIDFHVNTTNIQGVTGGHIHSGAQGENGEVVVTLFSYDTAQDTVTENGTFAATDLVGPMQGNTISDLIDAMRNNNTYVNVHTEQNPDGEIRGQIVDIN